MKISLSFLGLLLMTAGLMVLVPVGGIRAQDNGLGLALRPLPEYYYVEITPGENKTLYMEIENYGNKAVTNIRLYSDMSKEWTVDIRPETIDYLGAGSRKVIDVNVIADPSTGKGEYTLTVIAEADETKTITSTVLRVEKTFSFWQWVGLGIGVLVMAGFIILFYRFGRE